MPSSVGFDPTSLQGRLQAWLEAQLPALERGESTPLAVADALLQRSVAAGTLTGNS